MKARRWMGLLAAVALGMTGCDGSSQGPDGGAPDSGHATDSGSTEQDAGTQVDSGTADTDAGTEVDSGTVDADAGPQVDSGTPDTDAGTEVDSGTVDTDAGPQVDSGTSDTDAGTVEESDAGSPLDGGPMEPPAPCEKTLGVCAGAKRAWVDGAYEPVCTARSYGADYEETESRCDDLDNDCDGVTDPSHASTVAPLNQEAHAGMISSLAVDGGVLVAVFDTPGEARVLRVDAEAKLKGVTKVPVDTAGASNGPQLVISRLLRTPQGPALYYGRGSDPGSDRQTRGYLLKLDETGAPVPAADGGTEGIPVFEQASEMSTSRAGLSADGTTLMAAWRSHGYQERSPEVWGVLRDLDGQVLAGPVVLFHSEAGDLGVGSVLGLREGGFLVAVGDTTTNTFQSTVRVRRFDAKLQPVGDERTFDSAQVPTLVELGAVRGSPLDSVALLFRDMTETHHRLRQVSHLFSGGTPETWVEWPVGPDAPIPWYGARADARGLQLAWLAKKRTGSSGDYLGWLWTQGEGHAPVQQTPEASPQPLSVYAQWVLVEEVAPRQQAAFTMKTDSAGSTLEVVRTCVP